MGRQFAQLKFVLCPRVQVVQFEPLEIGNENEFGQFVFFQAGK